MISALGSEVVISVLELELCRFCVVPPSFRPLCARSRETRDLRAGARAVLRTTAASPTRAAQKLRALRAADARFALIPSFGSAVPYTRSQQTAHQSNAMASIETRVGWLEGNLTATTAMLTDNADASGSAIYLSAGDANTFWCARAPTSARARGARRSPPSLQPG